MFDKIRTRLFRNVQEVPWYRSFLKPVVDEIRTMDNGAKILDIGTGPGKLISLVMKNSSYQCVGVDINQEMLNEASKREELNNTLLLRIGKDGNLPFADSSFDVITFCSVLFLLDGTSARLDEASRILKPGGSIIILTPTGKNIDWEMLKKYTSLVNWSFWIWNNATRNKANEWQTEANLNDYADRKKIGYDKRVVFNNLAILEILRKE